MHAAQDSFLLTVLFRIAHAAVYLGIGVAYGIWSARRSERSTATTHVSDPGDGAADLPVLDTQTAEVVLSQLYGLTSDVAQGVGEHSSTVAAVSRELTNLVGEEKTSQPVIQAIASLLEANARLEDQLASASQKMQEQAKELECKLADALTDPLTGIPNRRAFSQELSRRLPEFRRLGTPLSLVMIDVDHFKKFNDTHGHQAGDEVLRGVGRVLKEMVREMDLPARFGGEEFAVILPTAVLETSKQIAERIRGAIEQACFAFEGVELRVTVSVGVTDILVGDDEGDLIKRADLALYAAKKAGRNCAYYHDGKEAHPINKDPNAVANWNQASDNANRMAEATDLPNRDQFFREVERRFSRRGRANECTSVLLVNVDRLEGERDSDVRQQVLTTLRDTLRETLREVDFLATFGPTTFCVLLSDKDSAGGVDMADLIRGRFAQRTAEKLGGYTTSCGIAEGNSEDAWASIINRAEQALASSVQHGGNCIHFHTDKTRQPMLADLQLAAH